MLVIFAAAIGFLVNGFAGAVWAVALLYLTLITVVVFG